MIRSSRISADLLPKSIARVALAGDRLALATQDNELWLVTAPPGQRVSLQQLKPLDWVPSELSLSRSSRFVLLRDPGAHRILVRDLHGGAATLEVGGTDPHGGYAVGVLAEAAGGEVLISSHEDKKLAAYALGTGARLFRADLSLPSYPYKVITIGPALPDNDSFFAVVYMPPEARESVVRLSLVAAAADPASVYPAVRKQEGKQDWAFNIAVGLAGADHAVYYRDNEDDEDDEDESEEQGMEPAANAAWCYNGFYIRRLSDHAIVQKVPFKAPLASGSPLCATSSVIAAVCQDRTEIFPRREGAPRMTLHGRAFALDDRAGRLAVLTEEGHIDLVDLPGE